MMIFNLYNISHIRKEGDELPLEERTEVLYSNCVYPDLLEPKFDIRHQCGFQSLAKPNYEMSILGQKIR